jgi:hypothetical protein
MNSMVLAFITFYVVLFQFCVLFQMNNKIKEKFNVLIQNVWDKMSKKHVDVNHKKKMNSTIRKS